MDDFDGWLMADLLRDAWRALRSRTGVGILCALGLVGVAALIAWCP